MIQGAGPDLQRDGKVASFILDAGPYDVVEGRGPYSSSVHGPAAGLERLDALTEDQRIEGQRLLTAGTATRTRAAEEARRT
jgi:hypothetical protein